MTETSEELPEPGYVRRIYRALGERGVLERVKGVVVGRAKAWEFDKQRTAAEKAEYRKLLNDMTIEIVRKYNPAIPIVQNLDFGHTDPQIPMPYGTHIRLDSDTKKIFATF